MSLVEDPIETIELAEKVTPALIVTDMRKPQMSGAEMATLLKASPLTRSIPILLLSAMSEDTDNYLDLFCEVLGKGTVQVAEQPVRTVEIVLAGKYPD